MQSFAIQVHFADVLYTLNVSAADSELYGYSINSFDVSPGDATDPKRYVDLIRGDASVGIAAIQMRAIQWIMAAAIGCKPDLTPIQPMVVTI